MASVIFTKSWPIAALVIAHLIWGINFLVAKVTLQEIPPMSLSFLRFALAVLLLSPFILLEKNKVKIVKADLPKLFAVGVLMVTLNIAFFYAGLTRTTVTSASVLTMVIPVLSVLAGWWFLKEKVYLINLGGIALGLIGAVLVIGLPFIAEGAKLSFDMLLGNFFIIMAAITWVIGALISKKLLSKYSTLTITFFVFLTGVVTFFVPAINDLLQNPTWPAKLTFLGILGLLFITIGSSIAAYFLFEWGLEKVGIIKADLFQYLEPIIAATLGILVLGEPLRISLLVGGLLIGLGVYWSTLAKEYHKHHKAHRH